MGREGSQGFSCRVGKLRCEDSELQEGPKGIMEAQGGTEEKEAETGLAG